MYGNTRPRVSPTGRHLFHFRILRSIIVLKQPVGIFVKNKRLDGFHCEAGCDTSNQTWIIHICSSFFFGNRHTKTCLLPILHVKRENWNPTALKKGLSTSRQHKPSSKFTFFETQNVYSKRLHVQ